MGSPGPRDEGGENRSEDDFDRIVAGLELSMPADLEDAGRAAFEPAPDVFDPHLSDALDDDDLDHFVPPEPEPFPDLDPATRAAWAILVGSPIVLLFMTVFALGWPRWLPGGFVLAFVGALVFLLSRRGNHDRGQDPDQGAVI